MGNNFPKMPRCTDLGPGFLPPFTAACKGGGSRQHIGLLDSMLWEFESSAWLAELLEDASGWKALV